MERNGTPPLCAKGRLNIVNVSFLSGLRSNNICRIALLIAVLLVLACVGSVDALPINLTSKNISVPWSGYTGIPTSGSFNAPSSSNNISYIFSHNQAAIRQTGNATDFKIYFNSSSTHAINLDLWRYVGGNFYARKNSINITTGLRTSNLPIVNLSNIPVNEGDYLGMQINGSQFYDLLFTSYTGGQSYYTRPIPGSSFNWSATTAINNQVVGMQLWGPSPAFVCIGDSITAGHPNHYSYIENSLTVGNISNQYCYQLSLLQGNASYQNMGIGSQKMGAIHARFQTDVVNLHPNVVIISGGGNNLPTATNDTVYMENITAMVDAALLNGITPIILEPTPWTTGAAGYMAIRDNWTNQLETYYAGDTSVFIVNSSPYIAQERAGGPAGNLWDIKTEYNAGDNVHFNEDGYAEIARAISDEINEINNASIIISQFTPSGSVEGVSPLTISFTDTSIGSPTSWDWLATPLVGAPSHFSALQNPTNIFLTGNYSVTLTASNGFDTNTSAATWINVSAAPVTPTPVLTLAGGSMVQGINGQVPISMLPLIVLAGVGFLILSIFLAPQGDISGIIKLITIALCGLIIIYVIAVVVGAIASPFGG